MERDKDGDGHYRKSKHFTLKDIEELRYRDAIKNAPRYADEHWAKQGTSSSYADIATRAWDPVYL